MFGGENPIDKITRVLSELINEGINVDDIMLVVSGMYVGQYYQDKYPNLKSAQQIGPLSEKDLAPIATRIMAMLPVTGLRPDDKKVVVALSSVITSLLYAYHATSIALTNNDNPGQYDPKLDKPEPGLTLDNIIKDLRRGNDE